MKRMIIVFLLFVFVIVPSIVEAKMPVVTHWETNIVEVAVPAARGISLDVDYTGHPHISYYHNSSYMKYSFRTGVDPFMVWSNVVVSTSAGAGFYYGQSDIALPEGSLYPLIAYCTTNDDLHVAQRQSNQTWLDWNAAPDGSQPSLSIDPNSGRWSIAYHLMTLNQIRYAYYSSGAWPFTIIGTAAGNGPYCGLDDPRSYPPSFMYWDGFNYRITTQQSNGSWVTDPMLFGSASSFHIIESSMQVDSKGNPHLVYSDTNGIIHAWKEGGAWTSEVAVATNLLFFVKMDLDQHDYPHIVFSSVSAGYIAYVRKMGFYWADINYLTKSDTAVDFDIALDSVGVPHIAYAANYNTVYHAQGKPAPNRPKNDFDGDGTSDLGCYYAPQGKWYIYKSTDGFYQTQFGYLGTVPITGDFDGDGKTDFGCYYAPQGKWYVFRSSLGFWQTQFGYAGTIPFTGDFDGDGKSDIGCYHPPSGNWYAFQSTLGFITMQFGYANTYPVVDDFDGDGKSDLGVYDPALGLWYFFRSKDGFILIPFGYANTLPVSGDFDGDGYADGGVFDPAIRTFFLMRTSKGFYTSGSIIAGQIPFVGDFDGDGRDDCGIFNPSNGGWYIDEADGGFRVDQFGFQGVLPLGGVLQ